MNTTLYSCLEQYASSVHALHATRLQYLQQQFIVVPAVSRAMSAVLLHYQLVLSMLLRTRSGICPTRHILQSTSPHVCTCVGGAGSTSSPAGRHSRVPCAVRTAQPLMLQHAPPHCGRSYFVPPHRTPSSTQFVSLLFHLRQPSHALWSPMGNTCSSISYNTAQSLEDSSCPRACSMFVQLILRPGASVFNTTHHPGMDLSSAKNTCECL